MEMEIVITMGKLMIKRDKKKNAPYVWVDPCPDADFDVVGQLIDRECQSNICMPRKSIQKWSKSDFLDYAWNFWELVGELYPNAPMPIETLWDSKALSHLSFTRRSRVHVRYLTSILDRIEGLHHYSDDLHADSLEGMYMKWFKYWMGKAAELYDDQACIMFAAEGDVRDWELSLYMRQEL